MGGVYGKRGEGDSEGKKDDRLRGGRARSRGRTEAERFMQENAPIRESREKGLESPNLWVELPYAGGDAARQDALKLSSREIQDKRKTEENWRRKQNYTRLRNLETCNVDQAQNTCPAVTHRKKKYKGRERERTCGQGPHKRSKLLDLGRDEGGGSFSPPAPSRVEAVEPERDWSIRAWGTGSSGRGIWSQLQGEAAQRLHSTRLTGSHEGEKSIKGRKQKSHGRTLD